MRLLLSLALMGFSLTLSAQRFAIEGEIADTTGEPLTGASIVLLQAVDSVMTDFALSDRDGRFSFRQISPGSYLVQFSYVGFATQYRPVMVTTSAVSMGVVRLEAATHLLDAAEISAARIPIGIRNDTIEYNADAFKTQPHAVAEELLRQLPGIQVDRNGNIKAQGKEVQQIMVDGKEFFGKDPKIASKNLPADAIDKVQVFDRKSEMSEFTGIDDGEREKTINLELKEDKKQGVFGNVAGGYGTDDRFDAKANINRFDAKTQMSFIGSANNLSQPSFSINDYINLSGGFQNMMEGEGGRMTFQVDQGDMASAMGRQDGLKTAVSAGINLNRDFGKKNDFHLSYFGNFLRDLQYTNTHRQNLLPENAFSTFEINDGINDNWNNRINWALKLQWDSTQRISFRGNIGLTGAAYQLASLQENFDTEMQWRNRSDNTTDADGNQHNASSRLLYRKLINRKGRMITGEVSAGWNQSGRSTLFKAENLFFESDSTLGVTIDQRQENLGGGLDYKTRLSLIEPIGKHHRLEWNYTHQNFRNISEREFFDILSGTPPQEIPNDLLSNQYQRDYWYHRTGLKWNLVTNKLRMQTGMQFQHALLKGEIGENSGQIRQDFSNLLPDWRLEYDFTGMKNFSAEYSTDTRPPTPEQLQPIVDNSDPLNIYIGNPDLKQAYSHRGGMHFMLFDQFHFINFFAGINGAYTRHPIVVSRNIDSLLRQITQPVNAPWEWDMNGFVSFGAPLKFMRSQFRLEPNFGYNRGFVYVNQGIHIANRINAGGSFTLENRKKEILDLAAGVDMRYTHTGFDDGFAPANAYLISTWFAEARLQCLKTWSLTSGLDYTTYSKEAFGSPLAIPLWKASLVKFLFDKRLKVQLSAFDLLNQNLGIRRSSQYNYLEETQTHTVGRYVMLGISYNLTRLGASPQGPEIEIIRGRN